MLGVSLGDTVATASLVYSRLGEVKYKALTEVELLKEARQLVVKTRNKLVHRLKLGTMVQGGNEPITRPGCSQWRGRVGSRWIARPARGRLTARTRWSSTT